MTDHDRSQPPAPGPQGQKQMRGFPSVWVAGALLVSLAVNMLVAGYFLGALSTGRLSGDERAAERHGQSESAPQQGATAQPSEVAQSSTRTSVASRDRQGRGGGFANVPNLNDPRRILRVLPPEARRRALRALRPRMPEMRASVRRMRESRRASVEILARSPYDAAAVQAAFDEVRSAVDAFQTLSQEAIMTIMATLSPEERALVGTAIREQLAKQRGNGGRAISPPPERQRLQDDQPEDRSQQNQ